MRVGIRNYGQGSTPNANTVSFTDEQGNDFYFSYKTLVAFRTNHQMYVCENIWGTTTGKHLTWIDGGNKKNRLSVDEFNQKYSELFESNKNV